MQFVQTTDDNFSFLCTRLSPTIGLEIEGFDLRIPLSADQTSALRKLLIKYKVLFFHDQDISSQQFMAFGQNFGTLEADPGREKEPIPELSQIHYGPDSPPLNTDCWHTDYSGREKPTMAILLHAKEIPDIGGDTLFADMGAAYRGLPEEVKQQIEHLTATHSTLAYINSRIDINAVPESERHMLEPHSHPIVRIHPESGERILYVNSTFTTLIDGLPERENLELISYLTSQASVPEYQVRFKWKKNSIAFWDNRSTQHYACMDYGRNVRRLERITLAGDKPLGVSDI